MCRGWSILILAAISALAWGADKPQNSAQPCSKELNDTACNPSKKDLKDAESAFKRGLKLQNGQRLLEALDEFSKATRLVPREAEYLTAREMLSQQLVFEHLQRGNADMLDGLHVEALAEFRSALQLDPQNTFAQQRLQDAMREWMPASSRLPRILANSGELKVQPKQANADFHYRGDTRGLLTQVASVYGIAVVFDDSTPSRRVSFDVGNVDFYSAMQAAGTVTKTFWTPLSEKQVLIAAETADNHRTFDRMVMRTFYLPGVTADKDLNDIANLLRSLFEIRFLVVQPKSGTIVVRAPQATVEAATNFLESLDDTRPQVMLDIRVYEISHTLVRNLGIHLPNQFQMFNIPAGALAALGGQNIQDLINQLIAGGGINQANSEAISALLAQLQNQQNSILSQPLATFGSGLTLMGVSLGTAGAQLSLNESWVKSLQHAYLRTAHGNDAIFRIGSRYPILNASFAPIFNTPAISQVLQNNTFEAPFPSVSYEDIGLNLKAKPMVTGASDVTLQLELQFRTVLGQALNGIPVISNREYKGTITLKDGEGGVVVGAVSRTESRSMDGIPGLGLIPGLNKITTNNSKQQDENELLVVITPHIVQGREQNQASEVWLKR